MFNQDKEKLVFYLFRGTFFFLVLTVTTLVLLQLMNWFAITSMLPVILTLLIASALAGGIILLDIATPSKDLAAGSGIFIGLLLGLLTAFALSYVIDIFYVSFAISNDIQPVRSYADLDAIMDSDKKEMARGLMNLFEGIKVMVALISCYVAITLVLHTKDDFRLVIPYVEFAKQIRGNRPVLLDSSVIIDGRVADIVKTGILQGDLIIPRFILNELQTIADSNDKLKRSRGRRGLDIVKQLQADPGVEISIRAIDAQGNTVDEKLVNAAVQEQARLMTNDFNLAQVAEVRGIRIINLNSLAEAMRPAVLPGEQMNVRIVKQGEGPGQGVGYLDDGTMVVVEHAANRMREEVEMEITSSIQTSAGRMVFGKVIENGNPPAGSDTAASDSPDDGDDENSPRRRPDRGSSYPRNPRR